MASSCRGKGVPCPCTKFKKGKPGKGCQNCGHSRRRHATSDDARSPPPFQPPPPSQPRDTLDTPFQPPPPSQPHKTVGDILAKHQLHQYGTHLSGFNLGGLKPLTSHDSAVKEVLPGYHGLQGASSSKGTRKGSSSGTAKKKQPVKAVKFQQIGSLLFLLCGMWAHKDEYGNDRVELRSDKPLTGPQEEELRENGVHLLIDGDSSGLPLQFSQDWSTQAIDKWLRGLAPKLFQYLDLTFGVRNGTDDQYHWRLVRQQRKRVFLFGKELVSGADLAQCMGGQARKKETFRLHIATRHPIDKSIWANLDRAIRIASKKPMDADFVDVIACKPAIVGDSSDEYSSGEDPGFDVHEAMEEAMRSDSSLSSAEDHLYPRLTFKEADKSQAQGVPLFDEESEGEKQGAGEVEDSEELNANGKRRRPMSPVSPRVRNTRLAKRARRAIVRSESPEVEQEQPETQNGHEPLEEARDSTVPSAALFIDSDDFDFDVPNSPGRFSYYYSPAPSPPPLFPDGEAEGSGSGSGIASSSKHVIRHSPGRPSKSAWKKRNAST